ncbi:conserved Plasmodium protein, unknown function [Plasmodium sp. DRC-Itaito]|nr:conserved Plasmodium protein, unknown function [Plasmodium sp. DRC-Itaito]
MKISNYIFGRIIDCYSYVDKIKEHLEFNRIKKHFEDAHVLDKFLNNYKSKIEYYRGKIKKNVHSMLRKDYICFDKNVDEDLFFVNRYVYYDIKNEDYIMICRKRLKRNFIKKKKSDCIGKEKEYIENKYIYDYCYKSLDELRKGKYISSYKSEVVVIFPSYFFIKDFKILRDSIFSFIIERNDNPLNFCYIFKGTFLIYDIYIKEKITKNNNIPCIFKNICNEQFVLENQLKKKKRRNKKLTNIKLNNNIHLNVEENKISHYNKICNNDMYNNYFINNNKRNNIFGSSNFIFPIINRCIFLKGGISNVEFLNFSKKDIFFLTTHIDKKYRCNQLFLNGPKCFKKLIYEEKGEEYFLNLYKSKDEKKTFLLSGSHLHNKLFLLNVQKIFSKKNIIKNNYIRKQGKQRKNIIIDMVKLISCRLRGKCFLENFYEHIVLICQGERNHVDIFSISTKDINYLIKRMSNKKYNNGKYVNNKKYLKDEKKKNPLCLDEYDNNIYNNNIYDNNIYDNNIYNNNIYNNNIYNNNIYNNNIYNNNYYNKFHFWYTKYRINIRKIEIPIDSKIKKLATLKNCNLQDFDMTKYGLVLYLYKYFLTPFLCIIDLKNIYIKTRKKRVDVVINNIVHCTNDNNNNNNNKIYNANNLRKIIKIVYLPIKKGSMSCGINNNFYNPFISFDICNTFINNIKLRLHLKKGILCLSKNINNIEGNDFVSSSSTLFESTYFKYDKELQKIYELHKNFCIKDVFLKTPDSKKIAVTLVYKRKNNYHICYDNRKHITSTNTCGMSNINDYIKSIFDKSDNNYEKGSKNKKNMEITNFFDYIINEETKINIHNNKNMFYANNKTFCDNHNVGCDNHNAGCDNHNAGCDNHNVGCDNHNVGCDNNFVGCDNNFVDDIYSDKCDNISNDFTIIFDYNLLSQINMDTFKLLNFELDEKNNLLLPEFIYPSKTIIHVYPFYNEMNLCTYNDEYYFYLLNNFVISYFHLRGSGGLLYHNDEESVRRKFIDKTKEKKKILDDFIQCINFLKYKNISDTEKISLYLYSNCGMIGGYILNHIYKIVKNIIFVNPLLDIFNNLTDCKNPHVPSEYLEFGSMNINDYYIKRNIHKSINNNSNNKIHCVYNKHHKGYRNTGVTCKTKYIKGRYLKGTYKIVRNNNNNNNKKYGIPYYLYTMCPYYNIPPNYKEHFCNNSYNILKEVFSLNKNNTNIFFKNNILLYLNKYDIICSNYNSIKYFTKYLHHKDLTINYYYYDHHHDQLNNDNGRHNKLNFINFKNNNEQNENNNENFYISFSDKGGHSGCDSSSGYLNNMLDKIFLHFFIN